MSNNPYAGRPDLYPFSGPTVIAADEDGTPFDPNSPYAGMQILVVRLEQKALDDIRRIMAEEFALRIESAEEWHSIAQPPAVSGEYIVHAPSADPDRPLIAMAWYEPIGPQGWGWSGMSESWSSAITHWMPKPKGPL